MGRSRLRTRTDSEPVRGLVHRVKVRFANGNFSSEYAEVVGIYVEDNGTLILNGRDNSIHIMAAGWWKMVDAEVVGEVSDG